MANTTRKKHGGRTKGTPNKDKQELIEMIQEKFPDWHPLLAMAQVANSEELTVTDEGVKVKAVDDNLKFQAMKEVCKYIVPQLKSVDHSIDTKHNITVTIGERQL